MNFVDLAPWSASAHIFTRRDPVDESRRGIDDGTPT